MVTPPTSITAIIPCLFHRLHFFPLRFYGSKGSEYPLTRGADQKVTSSCDCSTPRDSRRSALLREEEKTGFSSSSLLQLGSPTGPPSRLSGIADGSVVQRWGSPAPTLGHSPEGHRQDPLHLDPPLQHFLHQAFVWTLFDLFSSNQVQAFWSQKQVSLYAL